LLQTARADWERLFVGKDPSEKYAGVRADSAESALKTRALPGSGFLKVRKPDHTKGMAKNPQARFAH
jgi:hypothetical protein